MQGCTKASFTIFQIAMRYSCVNLALVLLQPVVAHLSYSA